MTANSKTAVQLIFTKWSPTIFWLILILLFISVLMGYTWLRVQNTKMGYALSAASQQQAQLLRVQTNLLLELSHLQSPERLAPIARHLELKTPAGNQIIVLP